MMIYASLCLSFICFVVGQENRADDSIIIDSPLHDTIYKRSLIEHSDLTKCNVFRSGIHKSTSDGSILVYSIVNNSTVTNSLLNVTYHNRDLDKTSTADVFKNPEPYFFNRVYDSNLVNAALDISLDCKSKKIGYNSTVQESDVFGSKLRSSHVIRSHLADGSALCMSFGLNLTTHSCVMYNCELNNSLCINSTIHSIKLDYATIVDCSFLNSEINGLSHAVNTKVENSIITNQSKIVDSKIVNSIVSNSKLKNCVIINTEVHGKEWDSVTAVNNMVYRNDMSNRQFFEET